MPPCDCRLCMCSASLYLGLVFTALRSPPPPPPFAVPQVRAPVEALLEVAAYPDFGICSMSFNFWHRRGGGAAGGGEEEEREWRRSGSGGGAGAFPGDRVEGAGVGVEEEQEWKGQGRTRVEELGAGAGWCDAA